MTQETESEEAVIECVKKTFIPFSQISRECGVGKTTPFNWANYHGYFRRMQILGVNVAPRSEFERFCREHPELVGSRKSPTTPT